MKRTVMSRLHDPGMSFPTKIEIPYPVKLLGEITSFLLIMNDTIETNPPA